MDEVSGLEVGDEIGASHTARKGTVDRRAPTRWTIRASDLPSWRRHFAASATTSLPRAPLYAALSAGSPATPISYRLLLHAPTDAATPRAVVRLRPRPAARRTPARPRTLVSEPRRRAAATDDPSLMPTFTALRRAHADRLARRSWRPARRRRTRSDAARSSCRRSASSPTRSVRSVAARRRRPAAG